VLSQIFGLQIIVQQIKSLLPVHRAVPVPLKTSIAPSWKIVGLGQTFIDKIFEFLNALRALLC
jgi:hypothetical protein